jgi:hypothetical protein
MSQSSITVGSQTYTLVTPANGLKLTTAAASISLSMSDNVASVVNPFTQQTQTQTWAGGDLWLATVTLPPMSRKAAAPWLAFLAALRGSMNVFQLGYGAGYGTGTSPLGTPLGTPVVSTAANAMATSISTSGWTASKTGLLLSGDLIQIGYRLHMVVDDTVDSDISGDATINIWPSVRESISANASIVTSNPVGLFRLADNKRTVNYSPAQATTLSFQAIEVR